MTEKDKLYQLRLISVCKISGVVSVKQFVRREITFAFLKFSIISREKTFAFRWFQIFKGINFRENGQNSRKMRKFLPAKVSALKVLSVIVLLQYLIFHSMSFLFMIQINCILSVVLLQYLIFHSMSFVFIIKFNYILSVVLLQYLIFHSMSFLFIINSITYFLLFFFIFLSIPVDNAALPNL